jgi:hypothetical protein
LPDELIEQIPDVAWRPGRSGPGVGDRVGRGAGAG